MWGDLGCSWNVKSKRYMYKIKFLIDFDTKIFDAQEILFIINVKNSCAA